MIFTGPHILVSQTVSCLMAQTVGCLSFWPSVFITRFSWQTLDFNKYLLDGRMNGWNQWFAGKCLTTSSLGKTNQPQNLVCGVYQFLWCKYSCHCGSFQATSEMSPSTELGRCYVSPHTVTLTSQQSNFFVLIWPLISSLETILWLSLLGHVPSPQLLNHHRLCWYKWYAPVGSHVTTSGIAHGGLSLLEAVKIMGCVLRELGGNVLPWPEWLPAHSKDSFQQNGQQ